jgi:hypothetical protein
MTGEPRGPRFLRGWHWPFVGPFWLLWQLVRNPGAWISVLAIFGLLQLGGFDLIKSYWAHWRESKEAAARLEQAKAEIVRLQGDYRQLADATRLDEAFELSVTRTGLFTWRVEVLDRDGKPVTPSGAAGSGIPIDVEGGLYQWIRHTMQDIRERAREEVPLSERGEDSYVLSSLGDIEAGKVQLALKTRLIGFEAPSDWQEPGSRKVDLGTWEVEIRGAESPSPVVVNGGWIAPRNEELWGRIAKEANPDQSAVFTPEVDLGSMPRGTRCRYAFRTSSRHGCDTRSHDGERHSGR